MSMIEGSLTEFTDKLASKTPIPGGGGASAYVAGLSAALGRMVAVYTIGKKKYADHEALMIETEEKLADCQKRLLEAVDKDAEAFEPLSRAYGLPKSTDEEKCERDKILEGCLADAAAVPLSIMAICAETADLIGNAAAYGSVLMTSDAGCAAEFCRAALIGASYNVYVNTRLMKDRTEAERLNGQVNDILASTIKKLEDISEKTAEALKS